jgi:hypothetical protein
MSDDGGQVRRNVETGISLVLAGVAFYGSFHHWVSLLDRHGQTGPEAVIAALCVDVGVYRATLAKQHDAAIGRKPKGLCSFPTLCLFGAIVLTLAGNVASAQPTAWGVIGSLIPGVMLLMSIGLTERDAAETARRNARKRTEAKARREEEEAEQQRLAEAERQRREAREEEEQRLAERERQRLDRDRRRQEAEAQRLAGASPSQPASVSPAVSAGGLRAVPPPEARASTPDRIAMWAQWAHVIRTERRIPTGAELLTAGGCSPESSLGRRMRANWLEIEPAKSLVAELGKAATGS